MAMARSLPSDLLLDPLFPSFRSPSMPACPKQVPFLKVPQKSYPHACIRIWILLIEVHTSAFPQYS